MTLTPFTYPLNFSLLENLFYQTFNKKYAFRFNEMAAIKFIFLVF